MIDEMTIFPTIYKAIHDRHDLSPEEVVALKHEAKKLSKLANLVKRRTNPRALLSKPKSEKSRTNRHGVLNADGVRVCKLCRGVLPHSTRDDYQRHMLSAKRRWKQQAASVYWHRVGYDILGRKSGEARNRRAAVWRTAKFKEIAPKTAAKMTDADIHRIVMTIYPRQEPANNRIRFPGWVRKSYS